MTLRKGVNIFNPEKYLSLALINPLHKTSLQTFVIFLISNVTVSLEDLEVLKVPKKIVYLFSFCFQSEPSKHSSDSEDSDTEQAVKELGADISKDNDQEAYLDLTLDEEASIIAEYKALLLSCGFTKNL